MVKSFLKPNTFKAFAFLLIGVFYIYFAKESICGAGGFLFTFCYETQGFPIPYLVTGDVNIASDIVEPLFLGAYFNKFGNFLLNPAALAFDLALIYLLACFMSKLFNHKMEVKDEKTN